MDRVTRLLSCLLVGLFCRAELVAAQGDGLFNAEGYRQAHYRSPTPATVEGAETLDTQALKQLLGTRPDTLLVDVYRQQWLHNRFIPDEDHLNLPGSLWLANTGDGRLTPRWERYFTAHLERATQGRRDWPVVFYCRSDCWLGWNAARRAHRLGYTRLYWYRDGIDAWQQAGLPLQRAEPAAMLSLDLSQNDNDKK